MRINYIELPKFFKEFIKIPDNIETMVPKIKDTGNFISVPLKTFVTETGLAWFKEHDVFLHPTPFLFDMPPNITSVPHIDSNYDPTKLVAINFVLRGYGEVQWVDVEGDKEYFIFPDSDTGSPSVYTTFKNIKNVTVTDVWTGGAAVIHIQDPHRIVTKEARRILLTMRPKITSPNRTMNDFARILESLPRW